MTDFATEKEYLIHLVRCALNGETPIEKPQHVSFEAVFDLAQSHDVANLAFYSVERLENLPDKALYTEWEASRDLAVTRDINQAFARDEIVCELESAGVRYIEVQGTVIKHLYPSSDLRTMSDIDFIIDKQNLDKAKEILTSLGYECTPLRDTDVNGFRPPNVYIEIHSDYFLTDDQYYGVMKPPFDSLDENGSVHEEELYIYNFLHIAKHFYSKGCGIRRAVDAYLLNRHLKGRLDADYLSQYFEKAGIAGFVTDFSALAECWFGDGVFDEKLTKMADYVFASSLHGTLENLVSNSLSKQQTNSPAAAKIKYLLTRSFPPVRRLQMTYPRLKKHKYLYPFYCLHRLFKAIFGRRKKKNLTELKTLFKLK